MMRVLYTIAMMLLLSSANYTQTSLFSGKNPYSKNYATGDVIKVFINNYFTIITIGDWNENFETKLKLEPDQKNIPFLKPSEQSKLNQRKQKERQSTSQKLVFELSGIVTRQNDGQLFLNATRLIQVDGKTTRIICSGIINERKISNGAINTDDVADLNLVIVTKPDIPSDKTLSKINQTETEGTSIEGSQYLTTEQKQQYLIQHLQEILGALK